MISFSSTLTRQNPAEQMSLEETIEATSNAANMRWFQAALNEVERICKSHQKFTTDNVRENLDKMDVHTKNTSALGAVMREAASRSWCCLANEWVQSERPEAHRRAVRVWKSLLYPYPF